MTDNQTEQLLKSQYSSFWLPTNIAEILNNRFHEKSEMYVALAFVKRRIADFVYIITNHSDIQVKFSSGKDSYANKNNVVISSKLNVGEIDVTVGLALHEACHVKYSNFNQIGNDINGMYRKLDYEKLGLTLNTIKLAYNMVEDLRIDSIAWHDTIGYRGYYQRLHEYYSGINERSDIYNRLKDNYVYESYIIYIMCLCYDPKCPKDLLVGTDNILSIIDIDTIHLKGTAETSQIVYDVLVEITKLLTMYKQQKSEFMHDQRDYSKDSKSTPKPNNDDDNLDLNDQDTSDDGSKSEGENSPTNSSNDSSETEDSSESTPDDSNSDSEEDNEEGSEVKFPEDGKQDSTSIAKIVQNVSNIQKHNLIEKKEISAADAAMIESYAMSDTNINTINLNNVKFNTIFIENISIRDIIECHESKDMNIYKYFTSTKQITIEENRSNIQVGISNGIKLASSLKLRDNVVVNITAGKRSGKIFSRSLHRIPSGYTDIFYHRNVTKYANTAFHLTLDLSGSMRGHKFNQMTTLVSCLAKAFSLIKNVKLSISLRGGYSNPSTIILYNSEVESISTLVSKLELLAPVSSTPEGLCFPDITKYLKKYFKPNEDNYIINISDGEPAFGPYKGSMAISHSKEEWASMLRNTNSKGLSYFVHEGSTRQWSEFSSIYGSDAKIIDANNLQQIINTINNILMSNLTNQNFSH